MNILAQRDLVRRVCDAVSTDELTALTDRWQRAQAAARKTRAQANRAGRASLPCNRMADSAEAEMLEAWTALVTACQQVEGGKL